MKNTILENPQLIAEFSQLGLYADDKLLLSEENVSALLSGRRTSLISIGKLAGDGFAIDGLDAKLSLWEKEQGLIEVKLHPIYNEPKICADLEPHEGWAIIARQAASMTKVIHNPTDHTNRTLIFEFDEENLEFVSYDPLKVKPPFQINGETLDSEQQQAFAHGKVVELSDGTKIQHRASEPKGIISDRNALIISVLEQQEISSFLLKDLSPPRDLSIQRDPFSPEFEAAFMELQKNQGNAKNEQLISEQLDEFKSEYSRGYGQGLAR